MLKKTAFYAVPAALALLVGACTTQQPAPVVAGTSGGGSAASSSNPYGATPYEPNAGNNPAESTPYTPPASQSYPAAASGGYIPSNAPVDINAATHTVVRGDTVYNIAKRYQITQDNLRAWNNMADNTISVGQVLRVKPAGYTAPAGSTATSAARTQPPAASSATPNVPSTPQANTSKVATPATTPTVSTGGVRNTGGITWQRPTAGTSSLNSAVPTKVWTLPVIRGSLSWLRLMVKWYMPVPDFAVTVIWLLSSIVRLS